MSDPRPYRRRRILAIAKSLARADIARWPNWSRIPAAHRAEPDAIATAYLLRDLLDEHPLEQLVAWSAEPALGVRIPFGDYKGQRWADVHAEDPADLASFCDWVLRRDFDEDLKFTAAHWLARIEAGAEAAGDESRGDGATDPAGAP